MAGPVWNPAPERANFMASVTRRSNGSAVQFADSHRKRQTIHAGKISDRNANRLKTNVEIILERTEAGEALDADTKAWLEGISDRLHAKWVRVGLVEPREHADEQPGKSLGDYLDYYFAVRSDVKDATLTVWGQVRNYLVEFFGRDKPLDEITAGDAAEWRIFLKSTLSENTIRKRCQFAKQFFNHAVEKGFIAENSLAKLKSANLANPKRYFFLSRSDAE